MTIVSYRSETHKAYIGKNEITVTGLTPVFVSEEEYEANKESAEHNLFQIFKKYAHN